MILFFVVSGFVIVISSERLISRRDGWKIFSVKRLIRIVPIYWLATTLKVFALVFAAQHVLHSELNILHVLKSYFFIPEYNAIDDKIQPLLGVGWTLVYEIFFYILFAFALAVNISPFYFVSSCLVSVAFISYFKDLFLDKMENSFLYFILDPIVLNFFVGMVLGLVYKRGLCLNNSLAVIAVVVGMLSIVGDVFSVYIVVSPLITIGIASFFVIWGSFSLEQNLSLSVPKPFLFLGEASYSIYLFHPLMVPLVPTFLARVNFQQPEIGTALGIGFALVASSVIFILIEQPVTRYLTTRFARFE